MDVMGVDRHSVAAGTQTKIEVSVGYDDFDEHCGASNLPPEALDAGVEPLDINDGWISNAHHDEQLDAMRAWWYARYEDPAHSTPYIGREGGYLYVQGGPFHPADELHDRFRHSVHKDVIQELVDELHAKIGDNWAPIQGGPDYEFEFDVEPRERHEPLDHFLDALTRDCDRLAELATEQRRAEGVLLRHAYIALVAALETYLWETTKYWVSADRDVLVRLITKSNKFKDRPMKLGEIFKREAGFVEEVNEYLRNLVWHRLDEVKPLMQTGLDVSLPSVDLLLKKVVIRHDLVHRNGRTSAGLKVYLAREHYDRLKRLVLEFCVEVEGAVNGKWPDRVANAGLAGLRACLAELGARGSVEPPDAPPDDF